MWIKTLRLENFQSHKDTIIDLHPNYNCIVGTGNSGKSSIVRALSFILFGKWDSSWVKHGSKECRITIVTDSDISIVREKGSGVNKYVLHVPGQAEQVYENFGTHVPDEIQNVTHMFKVKVGDKEELNLNMSNQLDQLFLLSNPGSFKAKVLGKLSKAHYLDYALREINKDKKRLTVEKTVLEKQKLELQHELFEYTHLEEKKKELDKIGSRIEKLSGESLKIDTLKDLSERTKTWKNEYILEKNLSDQIKAVDISNAGKIFEGLDELKVVLQVKDKLKKFQESYSLETLTLESMLKEKRWLAEKYVGLLKDNNTCPTCFGDIDPKTLDRFLETV